MRRIELTKAQDHGELLPLVCSHANNSTPCQNQWEYIEINIKAIQNVLCACKMNKESETFKKKH